MIKKVKELSLEEISNIVRPEFGADIGVVPWRLIRLIALDKYNLRSVAYLFGREIGSQLPVKKPEDLLKLVRDLKIGRAEVVKLADDEIIVDVFECATCAGIPKIGEPVCQFEAGIVGGALDKILGKNVKVLETKCWGLGDEVCRFEATIY